MKIKLAWLLVFFINTAVAEIKPFHIAFAVGTDTFTVATLDSKFEKKPGKHNNLYQFTSVTKASGFFAYINKDVMTESITMMQKDNSIYPLKYQFSNKTSKGTETASLVFDHYKNVVHHQKGDKKLITELKTHAFDNSSIILGLMSWVKEKNGDYKKGDLVRAFDNHDHLKTWSTVYKIDKEEMVDVPYGKIKAVKLVPAGKPAPLQANIWLSPKHGYIPVKFEHLKDGDVTIKIELKKIY